MAPRPGRGAPCGTMRRPVAQSRAHGAALMARRLWRGAYAVALMPRRLCRGAHAVALMPRRLCRVAHAVALMRWRLCRGAHAVALMARRPVAGTWRALMSTWRVAQSRAHGVSPSPAPPWAAPMPPRRCHGARSRPLPPRPWRRALQTVMAARDGETPRLSPTECSRQAQPPERVRKFCRTEFSVRHADKKYVGLNFSSGMRTKNMSD